MTVVRIIVRMIRERVTGTRVDSASVTDWPVRNDAPRSPVTQPGEPVEVLDDQGPIEPQLCRFRRHLLVARVESED